MQPKKRKLKSSVASILSLDPLTKRNIDLINRFEQNTAVTTLNYRDTPEDKLLILGDAARLRLEGRSGEALNIIERFIKKYDIKMASWRCS